jgi:putative flavoprotein involved in K+ transport
MGERVETIVIGGGQAGLAVSYHLTRHGREHVVLERGRVAETWRTQRWDGFLLNTPNFFLQLPGDPYSGEDPDAFLTRDETIAYLERYADHVGAPVREGVHVTALRAATEGGYELDTNNGGLEAENVVVATGAFQEPTDAPATDASPQLLQLHSSAYRSPDDLPAGGVFVVGSGQSGCQIAAELNAAGRDVVLSVGRCPWLPSWYRGRQMAQWVIDIGLMDETVDVLPSPAARLACNPALSNEEGGHHCSPRRLAADGVTLVGRVESIFGTKAVIRADLNERLAEGDAFEARLKERIDEYVRANALDLPEEPSDEATFPPAGEVSELDLEAEGVATILWANGFRPDYGWIHAGEFDEYGWPVQRRGVGSRPGLYFVGLHWLHKRKSALLLGVGEDAEHVVSTIVGDKREKEEEE